jgi:hypothetical protein
LFEALAVVYVVFVAPVIYPVPNFHLYAGVPPFVELAVNAMLIPAQIVVALEDTLTVGVTDEVTVTVAVLAHPLKLVYEIILVPIATPVTRPALLTVDIAGVDETHALLAAAVVEPVN